MKAAEILRGFNDILDLGDLVYYVREQECKGWEGPKVTRWDALYTEAQKYFNAPMDTWKQRVRDELAELNDRLKKLGTFICSNKFCVLPEYDKVLLSDQHVYMLGYRRILEERINRWGYEA